MSQASGRRRRVVLAVLGTVLLTTVLGANLVVGAERTVMDRDFVGNELEEAGVYESMAADVQRQILADNGTNVSLSLTGDVQEPPLDRMAESVVTPTYVQGQVEDNLETLYAYLEGERGDLPLAFDLEPVKAGFSEEMAAWVADLEPGALSPRMGDLAESESSFHETRESFRETQLRRIQNETPRERTREELLEIYDDNRDRLHDRMVSELETRVAAGDGPAPVQEASVDYGTVGIDSLVAENASYDAFLDREAVAHEDLAAAVGRATRQRLDEDQPDRMDLLAGTNGSATASLAPLRTGVSVSGALLVLFPLAAIGSAGALAYTSRRRSRALRRVGVPVAVAGLLGFAATVLVSRLAPSLLNVDAADPSPVGDGLLGVVAAVSGTIGIQSLALVAVGLALVGVGVAVGRGALPVNDAPGLDEPLPDEPASDDSPSTATDADEGSDEPA